MNDRLLTTEQAAEYLNVKPRILGAHWRKWGLSPYKVGRRNQFRLSELDRWLESRRAA
jgi:excisionase family DNA binding protein